MRGRPRVPAGGPRPRGSRGRARDLLRVLVVSRSSLLLLASVALGVSTSAACTAGSAPVPAGSEPVVVASTAFAPNPPSIYVAKVKSLLVGLPPTTAEVQAVGNDPTQLQALIGQWMTYPEYTAKMQRFFALAFEQTQVAITDFAAQVYPRQADANASTSSLLVQNATESFARTMVQLTSQNRPLTEATTTQSFMMTPALMELYAFLDAWQVDDAGNVTDRFAQANPGLTIRAQAAAGPVPLSETLDPTSANYMHWYDPDVADVGTYEHDAACAQDPNVFPASGVTLHYLLYGALDTRKSPSGVACPVFAGTAGAPQITGTDFTDWKMIAIRTPDPGESTTRFYDLATLRTTNELVLSVPRIGFFSTPAFFANWQTNASNEARVTTNQSLIVALGSQVDGNDTTVPPSTPGLDTTHAAPGTTCHGCHQLLDPTRSVLAATYSWGYHQQTDATYASQEGLFAFRGLIARVSSPMDFGRTLASHPLFASAWVQKLCYYFNSSPCATSDPEFEQVVSNFVSSGYSWSTLVRQLLSSPLTTYAAPTQTALYQGEVVAVSRRDHLCAALDARLGLTDVCGLLPATPVTTTVPEIAAGLPSDGYGRGSTAPVLPNQPTLFYRAGTENICEDVAALVIDVASPSPGAVAWSSTQPDAAIDDFVSIVMALHPSDSRSAPATRVLQAHFQAAMQSGASAPDSLKSTFTAACLAPSAVSIGL